MREQAADIILLLIIIILRSVNLILYTLGAKARSQFHILAFITFNLECLYGLKGLKLT
jgi:hypothetical protein